ncbi:aspartate-semialdehyde dehydrogenase [Candidatus Entotheonella palauensis]|uniref:aspartate-semialdehyde dehydrogenase n=1 Tax=Candidatus Entotheonella gemina TaxID=1429439 RepID=W4MC11_9BACT|nr:aspartate-semialdehyde dehydrogenase [Candidatus Entotheonella palauensis]ETX07182.1 MAG: aspartate-semialdehyde dehydrogenase [Candidatus Entotheonella gemina]
MLKAAIVGATGIVGQQFVLALQHHPWFTIEGLAASQRSAGQSYGQALRDPSSGALRWYAQSAPDPAVLDLPVELAEDLDAGRFDVIFTGMESAPAKVLEPLYAKQCPVLSTASAFRYEDDVPVLIPAVNDDHIALLEAQRQKRGWQGFITPQPNCTTLGAAITLAPIATHFGIDTVVMTSMQAVSGSGRNGGVLSLDIVDNVIPYISGEEEKVQREIGKVLGQRTANGIVPADLRMSATCTRVPVIDGHTESMLVITKHQTDVAEVRTALEHFGESFVQLGLPSSPQQFIVVHDDPFRPQPRLDRDTDDGMATVVGRLRADTAFENGLQYVLVSHNTKMGAAKGSVLTAELLAQKGYIGA